MTTSAVTGRRATPFPDPGEQTSLGSFPTYGQAQRVVDQLADQHFDVETTQIIGTDLRMVEQVTGRLTWPRALASGAVGGGWFGIFVGLLLAIVTTADLLPALGWGLTWGIPFGAVFAAVGYGLTRGRRDFTSVSLTLPSRFEVVVAAAYGERARTALAAAIG
jgi:hypothetical protein